MRSSTTFALGMLARALSVMAGHYSDWLLHKVSQAPDAGCDFLRDFWQFCRRLMAVLAERLGGRPARHYSGYEEEEYESELFGAR